VTPPSSLYLFETHAIVRIQKVSERGFRGVESQLGAFAIEPFFVLGVLMRFVGFDSVRPSYYLSRALGRAVLIKPGQEFFIAGARL
jgi:hypothetical protein